MSTGRLNTHLKLALASIPVFADDGRMAADELETLVSLALEDGVIDEEEKRVLANILQRAEQGGVESGLLARIAEVRAQHGLPDGKPR